MAESDKKDEFVTENIVNYMVIRNCKHKYTCIGEHLHLVQWYGYPPSDPTG